MTLPSGHEAVLAKLEFPEILRRLAQACRFSVAAERALELGEAGEHLSLYQLTIEQDTPLDRKSVV